MVSRYHTDNSRAIVPGSIGSVAARSSMSMAEAMLACEFLLLVDVSGSMNACDSRGGRQRYQVACEELARLQADHPGRIGVVGFSDHAQFEPSGVPYFQCSGTDLAAALRFALPFDGTLKFIVVSDGMPDDSRAALNIASQFKSSISCVYVGPEGDRTGAVFLERLAKSAGGRYVVADRATELADRVETLLLGAG